MYRVALKAWAVAALLFTSVLVSTPAQAIEAYIFRGAGDFTFIADRLSFSEGMDKLGDEFRERGVFAKVYRWEAMDWAYRDIMKRRPDAVAIMGHSMGALASISLANKLKGSGIRVAYMGLIDIPGPAAVVPSNVEVAENFYSLFPVYGKLGKPRGHKGVVRNEFVAGQIHITMDGSKKIHTAMLAGVGGYKPTNAQPVMQAYAAEPEPNVMERVSGMLTGAVEETKSAVTRNGEIQTASVSTHSGEVARSLPSAGAQPNETGEPVMLMSSISTDEGPQDQLHFNAYERPLTGTAVVTSEFTASGQTASQQLAAAYIPVPTKRPDTGRQYDTKTGLQPIE